MMQMARHPQLSSRDDNARWQAVVARDRTADGEFVYAVRSTGVYCRPSCPSRRPSPERVTFFPSSDEAERAGFRPCRRCRPTAPRDIWVERIGRACAFLARVDRAPSLARLAARFGGSPFHFQRRFKQLVGVTPREYVDACRLRRVKRRLREDNRVTEALLAAGYGSSSRFYERAVPKIGMTPTTYQNGGVGMSIRYAITDSPLGRLLVAETARGVCAVAMGVSDVDLEHALAREYPAATIARDRGALAASVKQLLAHLSGRQPRLDLPLDVQATAFQWQVWNALGSIPYGETRSYSEVAAAIGRPRAVRAVARACATNPVALAIPCHRVVPANGGIGGYRWGTRRKRALLESERSGGSAAARKSS